ncbi:MAG: Rab family GTPase [Candidatus Kariarchaeaceae archaeon]|jgi:Ras-related protein Rab-1A
MSSDEEYDEIQIKCVVIGDPGSGKTSLRREFIGESFDTNYLQTIGSDFSYQLVKFDNQSVGLALWDLAGQPQFKSVHSLFYKGATAIIVVYDVSNEESFENVPNWLNDFVDQTNINNLPVLIIGNKIDLRDSQSNLIDMDQQVDLVNNLQKNPKFDFSFSSIQTSAKTGENVEQGILDYTHDIVRWITNNKDVLKISELDFSPDPSENFPFFYQIAMNQISGPIIVGSLPKIPKEEYDKHKRIVTKLLASFNFEDVTTNLSITGRLEILELGSPLIYNAFNIENEDARGSSELYITAFTVSPNLLEAITGLKGVVDGYLHNSMNRFQKIRIEKNLDFITKSFNREENPHENLISDVLEHLRNKLQKTTQNWLVSASSDWR